VPVVVFLFLALIAIQSAVSVVASLSNLGFVVSSLFLFFIITVILHHVIVVVYFTKAGSISKEKKLSLILTK